DGTLIETDRVRTPGPTKNVDLWWSGKHHHHGGNVQVVSAPDDGWILWVSDVRPGREHDTTAARAQDIDDALDDFRGIGGETFADLGYEGLQGAPERQPRPLEDRPHRQGGPRAHPHGPPPHHLNGHYTNNTSEITNRHESLRGKAQCHRPDTSPPS